MTGILSSDSTLIDSVGRFFDDTFGLDAATEYDQSQVVSQDRWNIMESLGITLVGVDETGGGSGGTLRDLLAVLMASGRYAVPLPVAETSLAAWVLAESGLNVPRGMLSVAPARNSDTLTIENRRVRGVLHDIPWARLAQGIVTIVDDRDGETKAIVIDPKTCIVKHGEDLAGQPRDTLMVDQVVDQIGRSTIQPLDLVRRGGLYRAAQMAGSLTSVESLTREYVSGRTQFGRPVGTFQAVQLHSVAVAEAAEMATLSVWRAAGPVDGVPTSFEADAAKLIANRSARDSVRAAHQAHGAIGMTREYPLHLHTRRLNSWQQEFGTERELSAALGFAVANGGSFTRTVTTDHPELP
jgi:acyl-CoA dehydrogenase